MANIIRCEMPNSVHRFKPFKISDYRDFLLIRNDLNNHDEEKQVELVNELAADYFSEYPKSWQQYMFLKVFTGSMGKTKIPISYECPICKKEIKRIFNISLPPLTNPSLVLDESTTLNFKFPDEVYDDIATLIKENIVSVDHDGKNHLWETLTDETKSSLIDLITLENADSLIKKMKPIYLTIDMTCCGKTTKFVYNDLHSIFKFLINPSEIFTFYEINHMLVKNGYTNDSIMNMIPVEKTFVLSVIERENKK